MFEKTPVRVFVLNRVIHLLERNKRCYTLVGGVGKASLVLGLASDGVVGDGTLETLAGSIAVGSGVDLVGGAIDTDGRVGSLRAGLTSGTADGTRADVDGGAVGGVEVGSDRGVLRLGEVGGALIDNVLLVLVGLVDDGLGLGGVGSGGNVAAVGVGGLGLRLTDVLLGEVEGAVRHFDGVWWGGLAGGC